MELIIKRYQFNSFYIQDVKKNSDLSQVFPRCVVNTLTHLPTKYKFLETFSHWLLN